MLIGRGVMMIEGQMEVLQFFMAQILFLGVQKDSPQCLDPAHKRSTRQLQMLWPKSCGSAPYLKN
jgi:hypothetical protein